MRNNHDADLDKTRKLEPISHKDSLDRHRSDIEIKDVEQKKKPLSSKNWLNAKRIRIWVLLIVFFFALIGGFYLSSYYNDQKQLTENESIHQQQDLKKQQADIDRQKEELEKQRSQLEREKNELNSGRNSSGPQTSWLDDVIGSLTGEKEKKAAQKQENNIQIDKEIAQAQTKIDEINNSLGKLDAMRQEVSVLQEKLTKAYENNKDLIDIFKLNLRNMLQ